MKKTILIIMSLVLMITLISCGNNESTNVNENSNDKVIIEDNENVTEETTEEETTEEESTEDSVEEETTEESTEEAVLSFEDIINQMYESAALELPMMGNVPLDKENMAYMLGVDNFDFVEGLVSEPMMGSFAHSVVMFSVEEGADIETIKSDIKNNVDGRKWICVGVEDENILVENVDNTIVLIMSEASEALADAFYTIMK